MTEIENATCLIAGGGPAGLMCGCLLARSGVNTIVLEKHEDFLRDFRGDTIHPSTLEIMHELGVLENFLRLPHQDVSYAEADIAGTSVRLADFTRLPVQHQRLVLMPQWNFLNFISQEAKKLPNFKLLMKTEAKSILREGERVSGLRVEDEKGERDIHASGLVIAADGRNSRLRDDAGLLVNTIGAPMDVLWFKLNHRANDDQQVIAGRVESGQFLVMIYRGDYWQCALIICKGTAKSIKARGIEDFRRRVAKLAKRDTAEEIKSWDDVKLLAVQIDRLKEWHKPGLLFIGDAAHAMSPIGGVGINLAIQDAVAAANLLYEPLGSGQIEEGDLARVQRRRAFPTWATQQLQIAIQKRVIGPTLRGANPRVIWPIKLMQYWPWLQRFPARVIGLGFRPEHVHSPLKLESL
ncbi:FAD-dependent oxidoreductase [Aquicoccus sp. G2-2]|uniref:FAD-dependent oxidoreductase n=1 Tax=Aquicoccus sp. G2-2 TaxID=3092120 RepID=UPI002AE01DFB|nr:FAD-dependent oxidoreductase [Aquicoccus sp. G2-2]MEA1115254.1 FAD-dependent oxidoreductase [Aquicoccus sp. G2-2]